MYIFSAHACWWQYTADLPKFQFGRTIIQSHIFLLFYAFTKGLFCQISYYPLGEFVRSNSQARDALKIIYVCINFIFILADCE